MRQFNECCTLNTECFLSIIQWFEVRALILSHGDCRWKALILSHSDWMCEHSFYHTVTVGENTHSITLIGFKSTHSITKWSDARALILSHCDWMWEHSFYHIVIGFKSTHSSTLWLEVKALILLTTNSYCVNKLFWQVFLHRSCSIHPAQMPTKIYYLQHAIYIRIVLSRFDMVLNIYDCCDNVCHEILTVMFIWRRLPWNMYNMVTHAMGASATSPHISFNVSTELAAIW